MGRPVPALPQVILPAFDIAMKDAAEKHLDAARLLAINNDQDYEAVGLSLKDSTARMRMAEAALDQHTTPINQALKQIRLLWAGPMAAYTGAVKLKKQLMADYLGKKAAEQRRLQQLADEQANAERLRLEARANKADAAGKPEKAAALAYQAANTMAPVIRTEAPKIAGQSVREVWEFQIEDASLIPREYLMPDVVKIRRYVAAMKADAKVAGVRIYSEKRIASGV